MSFVSMWVETIPIERSPAVTAGYFRSPGSQPSPCVRTVSGLASTSVSCEIFLRTDSKNSHQGLAPADEKEVLGMSVTACMEIEKRSASGFLVGERKGRSGRRWLELELVQPVLLKSLNPQFSWQFLSVLFRSRLPFMWFLSCLLLLVLLLSGEKITAVNQRKVPRIRT